MSKNGPNRRAQHLYAVLRFDRPWSGSLHALAEQPSDYITVNELLPTEEEALREVERLTTFQRRKGMRVLVQIGRFYADGRGLDPD